MENFDVDKFIVDSRGESGSFLDEIATLTARLESERNHVHNLLVAFLEVEKERDEAEKMAKRLATHLEFHRQWSRFPPTHAVTLHAYRTFLEALRTRSPLGGQQRPVSASEEGE